MARRKRTSAFEDLITLISRLPWWVGVLLAVAAWFILHPIAISQPAAVKDTQQLGQLVVGQMFRTLAMGGQYILPVAFGLGAIGSVIGRIRRRKLLFDVASATQPGKTLDGISWQQFELLVGEAFRRQGFTVSEQGGSGPDGGIDLILHKSGEKHLVQCKQWRALKVGVTVIREFFGVMAAEGAVGGYVVTSGTFTAEAKAFASGRNIHLVDNSELKRWIAAARSQTPKPAVSAPVSDPPTSAPASVIQTAAPNCPICNSAMQQRTAKRGVNTGNLFWGCSTYPKCRGTQ
ncbi:MAG: restriction endonuclease [Pseudomonas sp.]|uniref:restriction endonuclease n=1 Tax=Pseudomonas sp. TaxID=306 RepID=UPI003399AAD5